MDIDMRPRAAGVEGPLAIEPDRVDAGAALVEALRDPACYPHRVERVELIETHISWVLLAGEHAYKLKKPLRLPFLDYSTLELRRRFCEEELRLNRRAALGLYLGVVAITGSRATPRIAGAGEPIEHAVHMRRFPQQALASEMARAGRLTGAHVDALADAVARLHDYAARAVEGRQRCADPGGDALANFAQMRSLGAAAPPGGLEAWTREQARALAPRFAERASGGCVRECHGDLHLANVAWVDGEALPFDGIEFSEPLRWTDVAADVAFTFMDLHRHGLPRLAARFASRYLERTGDYGALAVLRFYAVYRAMVRAKVEAIAHAQGPPGSERARASATAMRGCVDLAARLARPGPALLVLMHGVSASGKTTVAAGLVEALGAVRVRSDVERKRLRGLSAEARAAAPPGAGIYGEADSRATYERLEHVARTALASGYPVVVDAASLGRGERDRFARLAREAGAAFRLVCCTAPEEVLRARIAGRARAGADASDADLAVLAHQLRHREAPGDGEPAIVIDTTLPELDTAVDALAGRLLAA